MRKSLRIAPLSMAVLLAALLLVTNPATGSTARDEDGARTTIASRILVAAATAGAGAAGQANIAEAEVVALATTTTTEPAPTTTTTEPPPPPPTTTTTAPPPTTTTTAPPPPPPPPPATDAGLEDQLREMINAERSQHGLAPLHHNEALAEVARAHVVTLPTNFAHSSNLGSRIPPGWLKCAENVGFNTSLAKVHTALMNSDGHRANILHPDYNNVGVGVHVHDGRVYVTQVFAQY